MYVSPFKRPARTCCCTVLKKHSCAGFRSVLAQLTKNTIIGRLHRNGMTRRETGPKFVSQRNFFDFSGPGCLWPHGHPDDPQFHFCGHHPLDGKPYCAVHAAIAYIRPREEKQAA